MSGASRPAADVMASTLLFDLQDILAGHAHREAPMPAALCGEIAAGMADLIERVMSLEGVARSGELLPRRELYAVIGRLPRGARRAIARDALERVSKRVGARVVEVAL